MLQIDERPSLSLIAYRLAANQPVLSRDDSCQQVLVDGWSGAGSGFWVLHRSTRLKLIRADAAALARLARVVPQPGGEATKAGLTHEEDGGQPDVRSAPRAAA